LGITRLHRKSFTLIPDQLELDFDAVESQNIYVSED
jgi:hypothetical protein